MIAEIDVRTLRDAWSDGGFVVDVREPQEYMFGHVPGAVLMPMSQVHARLSELPRDRRVHVICASGNRSYTAASWMIAAGVDACSVTGGTYSWSRGGLPLERGPQSNGQRNAR